jgi:hypothetical protein
MASKGRWNTKIVLQISDVPAMPPQPNDRQRRTILVTLNSWAHPGQGGNVTERANAGPLAFCVVHAG